MRKKYIGIALPESLIKQMDKVVKEDKWGFRSRAELTKQAIRNLIIDLRKGISWGTFDQYSKVSKKMPSRIGLLWEMKQVLKDKPAFLDEAGWLTRKEMTKFAKEHNLVYRETTTPLGDVIKHIAKNEKAMQRLLQAKTDREMGLALGYIDLKKNGR